MGRLIMVLALAALTAACGEVAETVYGAGVTSRQTIAIAELLADPAAYEGKRVIVEGLVVGVCAKRGCWFRMAPEEGYSEGYGDLQFKVVDGVMVFPMSMQGKYAVAEGVVKTLDLDLEQTRRMLAHQAQERGETFDPATVTEAKKVVRLDGTGAAVRDKR